MIESLPLFDLAEARARRDAGIALVTEHSTEWQAHARAIIEDLAKSGEPFSADEFHARLTELPHHHNAVGAAFKAARKAGLIRKVGSKQSERPEAHARLVCVYQGVKC